MNGPNTCFLSLSEKWRKVSCSPKTGLWARIGTLAGRDCPDWPREEWATDCFCSADLGSGHPRILWELNTCTASTMHDDSLPSSTSCFSVAAKAPSLGLESTRKHAHNHTETNTYKKHSGTHAHTHSHTHTNTDSHSHTCIQTHTDSNTPS